MSLAILDIILGTLILILIIRCALRGFIEEVMSMASFVLGILGAVFFHKNGAVFVRERFMPGVKVLPEVLAFIALFLMIFVVIKLVEHILRDIVTRINLGGVDRFLGIIFGVFEGIALAALVVFFLKVQPLFDSGPLLRESVFARFLLPLIGIVRPSLVLGVWDV
ncbi:MAG: CvpA family protein [Spirochaetaceae bacterium]|jgi:membrane protein required for colicin V production|nr:CvpA family protein [Spirochaetaceae bacterium]